MTTPDPPRQHSKRVLALASAAAVVAIVAGCGPQGDGAIARPASRVAAQPTTNPFDDLFPGLYLSPESGVVQVGPGWVGVGSALPCPAFVEALGAGQWTVTDSFMPPPELVDLLLFFGQSPVVRLERGDAVAFAALQGEDQCDATLSRAVTGPLVLSGAAAFSGQGAGVATQCATWSGMVTVSSFVDDSVGGVGLFATIQAPAAVGAHPLQASSDGSDGVTLVDYEPPLGLLGTFQAFYVAALAVEAAGGETPPFAELGIAVGPLGFRRLVPAEAFAGTVNITSIEPIGGNVHIDGLGDELTGEIFSVDLSFACTRMLDIPAVAAEPQTRPR